MIRNLYKLFFISLIICSNFAFSASFDNKFETARLKYKLGHFEQAIDSWQQLLNTNGLQPTQQIRILIQLANICQTLGLSQQAQKKLQYAELLSNQLTNEISNKLVLAKLFAVISDNFLARRKSVEARHYIDKSIAILPEKVSPILQTIVFNSFGNILVVEGYYQKAIRTYIDCIELLADINLPILKGRIFINLAQAYLNIEQSDNATKALISSQQQFKQLDDSYIKVFGLIGIAKLLQNNIVIKNEHNLVYQVLSDTLNIALKLNNPHLLAYTYGLLGHLYELKQQYRPAIKLTQKAIFYAQLDYYSFFTQQNQASEILYLWQWQLGRLFTMQKQTEAAIASYNNAVDSLRPIRQEIALGYRNTIQSFRERVGPVYFELADLLLQQATKFNHNYSQKETYLKRALEIIERFKTAELQDYFQDECIIKKQFKQNILNTNLTPATAIIYPIILTNRTEILLSLPGQKIQQFIIPITSSQLKDAVNEFRFELQTSNTNEFLPYAQRLHNWLIKPLSASLVTHKINTLIIVPDSVLRTIPFSALHNGENYLISKYAIGTMPGLALNKNQPDYHKPKILLTGLSESINNYSVLPSVANEITMISNLYKQHTVLLNESFTIKNFTESLENSYYSILHIASHGQFDGRFNKNFLLTYDGQLTINKLEKLLNLTKRYQKPLNLLTLSACQTAVGDDQAALGLAGVALKAGANSALASLWFINDKATSLLMHYFYQQLQIIGTSKVKALQIAQKHLLKHSKYKHPAYWASFLLIGNWQ
ncbi:MAG: tetratricopeptide repeat protein [Thiomargarita sp.]|nr:tetratricopeptide repeat protein [Thiomargarita sp.]